MNPTQQRRSVLVDLIELRRLLRDVVAAVRELPWDSDDELVLLGRANVVALLQRYQRGELGPAELEVWANAIEGREDIGAEPGDEDLLRVFVFETANPLLAEPISDDWTCRWLQCLNGDPQLPAAKVG